MFDELKLVCASDTDYRDGTHDGDAGGGGGCCFDDYGDGDDGDDGDVPLGTLVDSRPRGM